MSDGTAPRRTPVLVHAWMSTFEMAGACGLTLRRDRSKAVTPRTSIQTYSVYNAANERLFTGDTRSIKLWLRREGYVA